MKHFKVFYRQHLQCSTCAVSCQICWLLAYMYIHLAILILHWYSSKRFPNFATLAVKGITASYNSMWEWCNWQGICTWVICWLQSTVICSVMANIAIGGHSTKVHTLLFNNTHWICYCNVTWYLSQYHWTVNLAVIAMVPALPLLLF